MVHVDLTTATQLLRNDASYTADNYATSQAQLGKRARLRLGDKIRAYTDVVLVAWMPSYGHSRWLVEAADGTRETVAAARLELITWPAD